MWSDNMTIIKDGTGQGFLAKVDEQNRLSASAVAIPEIAHVSIRNGFSFQIEGETKIEAGTEKTVLILINNSDNILAVERVFTSIQGESGKVTTIKLYLGNKTFISGGTAKTPKNLNNVSVNTIDVTVRENNPTLGGSDTKIQGFYMEQTDSIDTNYFGSIILGRGSSVRTTCTGAAGAAGTFNCDASILYYVINEQIHE